MDSSLSDISEALKPKFSTEEIRELDVQTDLAQDLFGRRYLPGFVGLNNLNKTDYINASIQALGHVRPLRDYFLKNDFSSQTQTSPLVKSFGKLMRKMWSNKRFKSNVDPHVLVQTVVSLSNKRFMVGKQAEAGEFIAWLLHHLHVGLGGTSNPKKKKKKKTIIQQVFQGTVEVTSRKRVKKRLLEQQKEDIDDRIGSEDEDEHTQKLIQQQQDEAEGDKYTLSESTTTTYFLQLTLDIPEKPLFKDDDGGLVIPQEPLNNILQKFNGVSFHDVAKQNEKRQYKLVELPNYLILHLNRFTKNSFSMDKNPTIVAFPVKNLDLARYVFEMERVLPSEEQIKAMSVSLGFHSCFYANLFVFLGKGITQIIRPVS